MNTSGVEGGVVSVSGGESRCGGAVCSYLPADEECKVRLAVDVLCGIGRKESRVWGDNDW